jgi:hypothetical protein
MGFLDFLTGKSECPRCGTQGAHSSGGDIRCPNPHCAYYDPKLGGSVAPAPYQPQAVPAALGSLAGARTITIQYVNYQGQQKVFTGDADSAARGKNHITLRVAPSGHRIVLARGRIQNLSDVEASFPQRVAPGQDWPTPCERQILSYHKKHRTTSARYEEIRLKYPNW